MNEREFSNKVVPPLRKFMAVSRNENSAEPGGPDLTYSGNERHGWVEVKVVHGGELRFQKYQLPWFKSRLRHCRRGLWVLALGEGSSGVYLFTASEVCSERVVVRTFFNKPWHCVALADLTPSLHLTGRRTDWSRVATLLLG